MNPSRTGCYVEITHRVQLVHPPVFFNFKLIVFLRCVLYCLFMSCQEATTLWGNDRFSFLLMQWWWLTSHFFLIRWWNNMFALKLISFKCHFIFIHLCCFWYCSFLAVALLFKLKRIMFGAKGDNCKLLNICFKLSLQLWELFPMKYDLSECNILNFIFQGI